MNLFDIEETKRKKAENNIFKQKLQYNKNFKKEIARILREYLAGNISYLIYINKLYEIHKRYKRSGFTKHDLIQGRFRFFKGA